MRRAAEVVARAPLEHLGNAVGAPILPDSRLPDGPRAQTLAALRAPGARSVRCVVLRGEWVLALRGEDYAHVLPGGKREPDEEPIFLDVRETAALSLLERRPWRRENRLFLQEAIRLLGKFHIRLA